MNARVRPSLFPAVEIGLGLSPGSQTLVHSAVSSSHTLRRIRPCPYRESSNAGCVGSTAGRFRITHPFHPLFGAEYELVTRRLTWGEDRVFYYDPSGKLKSLLINVTDVSSRMPSMASPLAGQRFVWTTFWNSGSSSISASRAARERRMCKISIAALDRIIMPHGQPDRWHHWWICSA